MHAKNHIRSGLTIRFSDSVKFFTSSTANAKPKLLIKGTKHSLRDSVHQLQELPDLRTLFYVFEESECQGRY